MKKLINATILITVLVASTAMAGQIQNSAPKQSQKSEEKMSKVKAQDGSDCQPQRAGVRCNRSKPRKPWFFGK
jgi:hypothetical protein